MVLKHNRYRYRVNSGESVKWICILNVCMFCKSEQIKKYLDLFQQHWEDIGCDAEKTYKWMAQGKMKAIVMLPV